MNFQYKNLMKITIISISLIFGLCAINAKPIHALPEEEEGVMYLKPSSVIWETPYKTVGDTFTVEARITDVADCFSIAFSLQWNATILEMVSKPSKGDVLEGVDTFFISPDPDNVAGTLTECAYTRLGGVPGVTVASPDSGLVATMTFNVTAAPPEGIAYETYIEIVNTVDLPTYWVNSPGSGSVRSDFLEMLPCRFLLQKLTYEVVVGGQTFYIRTDTNSSLSAFNFNATYVADSWKGQLSFNVTGSSGTVGFCNVSIPKSLWTADPAWGVLINGSPVTPVKSENATHTFLYFTYTFASTNAVQIYGTWIVPEFSTLTFLALFMVIAFVAIILAKKLTGLKYKIAPK